MDIQQIIIHEAVRHGVDPRIAVAVAKVESNMNPNAIGPKGEIGLFQVRPQFSEYSASELKNVRINVLEGLRILSEAQEACAHKDKHHWLVCYNVGIYGAKAIKFPAKFPYVVKIDKHLKQF